MNGENVSRLVEPRTSLVDFVRYELELTGSHVGCEHGICGACTVRIDGRSQRACLTFAVQVDGRKVETVEGLAGQEGELTDLQIAFRKQYQNMIRKKLCPSIMLISS